MYNSSLYLTAYGKIYRNNGAMTEGVTDETAEGMSLDKIETIIKALRDEMFRWKPARRVYIPKKHGKLRPLGLPDWSSKLVQEVMRLLLNAYYEPQFSDHSHGFRPKRGCHTALREIKTWIGTAWFIEGDISKCFDKLDHQVLLTILRENIHDEKFIRLISELLEAGYLEDWKYHATLSGTPQGGVLSPLLANTYLNKLDKYASNNSFQPTPEGRREGQTLHIEIYTEKPLAPEKKEEQRTPNCYGSYSNNCPPVTPMTLTFGV